jgi:RNA polymerase sigma-70 factor (ECF subfamily)
MADVREGDLRRAAVLFDRHSAAFFRYGMRMSGNREWSEDLVQEIFVRVLRYRETFRDGNLFTTWAYRIARNAYIDQARKRRFEVQTEEPLEMPVHPSNEAEQNQDLDLLRRALDRLPEQHREILALARFEQMPYERIAELLGIEVGTVKTRVHRAVKQLRDEYFQLSRRPNAWRTA